MVTFENTNNDVEYTQYYSITDAPGIDHQAQRDRTIVPTSARFIFKDGDAVTLTLTGRALRKDGSLSENSQMVPGIYIWNQQEWPDWLSDLYQLALVDYRANRQAEGARAVR